MRLINESIHYWHNSSMERTSTRVKDVAERAQVSVGTVSNMLNEAPWVAPEVRRRVLAAINELGYVRNDTARRLRTGPTFTCSNSNASAGF